jgi:shikimate kinase
MDVLANNTTIILVGPKHAGKTSAGKALAAILGGNFTDLDEQIELRTGKSVRALYKEGPGVFRQAEADALASLIGGASSVPNAARIIAAGGGLADNGAALSLLRQPEPRPAPLLVYLHVSAETAWTRIEAQAAKTGELPPFLNTGNPRETHCRLHERRAAAYREIAAFTIDAEGKSPAELGEEILKRLGN